MKKLVALFLALSCGAAQASLIEYNDYTLDTDAAIVTGGGLEWLQWSETKGLSIAEVTAATSSYATDGWRLASNAEMSGLFNSWPLGDLSWDDQENSTQTSYPPASYTVSFTTFTSFFGETKGLNSPGESTSAAFFGHDLDNDGYFNHTAVQRSATDIAGWALVSRDAIPVGYKDTIYGIALVRDLPSVSVPEPASLGLLVVGLAGIAFRHRKN